MQNCPQRDLRKKRSNIVKLDNHYVLKSAPKKGLVLSGGGPKGLAYCGMIQAMHENGFLQNLTHVSGASAGAMTASLIAFGMSPDDIIKLATRLDIKKLLDNDGLVGRAKGYRFENVLEIIYMLQIKKHLDGMGQLSDEQKLLATPLVSKLRSYESALSPKNEHEQGFKIDSVDDIIHLADDKSKLEQLDKRFLGLEKVRKDQQGKFLLNARITFSDLKVLREILSHDPDKKHLIKHLSVITTNQDAKQANTHNEDNEEVDSLAQIIQSSGAHPVFFSPRPNFWGHNISDGGISDNMPIKPLLDARLHKEEILCVKGEEKASFQARVNLAGNHQLERLSFFDKLANKTVGPSLGGDIATNMVDVVNREKIFYNLDQMLYLDTGSITTTTLSPTQQEIQEAIELAQQQTKALLDRADSKFLHPLLGMIELDNESLDKILKKENGEMFWAAAQAGSIYTIQTVLANKVINNDESACDTLDAIDSLKNFIFDNADINLSPEEKNRLFKRCLEQADFLAEGKLMERIKEEEVKSANSGRVAWYSWLLNLLWMPIAWIIRKLSTKERDLEVLEAEATDRVIAGDSRVQGDAFSLGDSVLSRMKPAAITQRDVDSSAENDRTEGKCSHSAPVPSL